LWRNLIDDPEPLPRRLFAEIVENSEPDADSVSLLLVSITKLTAYDSFEATGASRAIHDFIDRLLIQKTTNKIDTLSRIVSGLNRLLDQEPHIERGECSVSEDNAWLLGPATHSVEHLISVRSKEAFAPDALAIINKVPEMRCWRGDHFDEYKNHLHELVPAWFELNDTLFWQHVEKVRARLAVEKSERLIDDWPVLWAARYWGFGAERFRDVLGFVENCTFEDDKLIALSLAYRLAVQPNSPSSWLVDIKETVRGHPALEERLDTLLNPTISQSVRELQEREEARSKKREEKKAERASRRVEWIARLKANPDVVRCLQGLKPGELSPDQYWLLREIEGNDLRISRRGGAEWKTLCTEFGEDVAYAYRDAAMTHWRNFTPKLRSEGDDTSSIPYALIYAMAGLEIEAREVGGFPFHLSEEEIRHALRYIVWELNGFPAWLETMHRAYPSVVLECVLNELHWELDHTDKDKLQHYILHNLVYHAPWLHKPLVEPLLKWMGRSEVLNQEALSYCIQIVISGDADTESLAKLPQSKITLDAAPEQLAVWHALWVDVDAENAIPRLEEWLSSLQSDVASQSAQLFITELMGGRRTDKIGKCRESYRNTENLNLLYILMHHYIQTKDDIERAGKGAYSPGLRDDAQDARDALFKLLSEIPGKATYVALSELARIHPELNYRPWMGRRAYQRAEEDADLESWSAQQVREFDQHQVRTPTTHRQLFDLTIDRLIDLKNWIERGNDSPYKTWQRPDCETEMRNLVAGSLNHRSLGRYSCAQESELANSQRPDIWTQCIGVASPVPIELKLLDKGWSGPTLCERLRNQLAGDYLREETAGCGVMLLIWQGNSTQSHWEIEGQRVELSELKDALKGYWNTIADNFPGVAAIEVILIDIAVRGEKSAT